MAHNLKNKSKLDNYLYKFAKTEVKVTINKKFKTLLLIN